MAFRSSAFLVCALVAPLVAQKVGDPAPDIVWTATHNFGDIPAKKLSELRGSVVLLEFVTSKQAAAREEVTRLSSLHQQKVELGLVVVTVCADGDDATANWVKRYEVKRPVAAATPAEYQLHGWPDSFLIDKDGKLLWRGHPSTLDRAQLDNALTGAKPAIPLPGLEEVQIMRRSKDYGAAYKKSKQLLEAGELSEAAQAQAKDWMQTYETFVADAIAAADKALAAKDVHGQWAALQPAADWYQGVPGADVCKTRHDALVADPKNKREIEAGRRLALARDKEAAFDYDGAYAMCKEVSSQFNGTKAAKDAAATMRAYEKDNKLGYDHTCGYCKAGGAACPTHRKKKK